jgi:hypothetical protein
MAASFVVEDGSGLSSSNSYVSVADADSYNENHEASTDWSGATQADKEKALRLATQYLDLKFYGKWKGVRTSEEQALAWPRVGVSDYDGYSYDSDEMPQVLKDACAELALRVIEGDTLLDDISKPGNIKSKSIGAGPLKKSVEYVGGLFPVKKYPLIENQVQQLTTLGGIVERG